MSILTGPNVVRNHVGCTGLNVSQVVVVLCSALSGSQHEMKEMFVRQTKTIGFRTRRHVRLVPDQIIPKDPTTILHRNRESRRDEKKLFLLTKTAHRCATSLARLIAEP